MPEETKKSILNEGPDITKGKNPGSIGNNNSGEDIFPSGEDPRAAGEGSTDEINDVGALKDRLAQEKARAEDLFGKLARMQADFENYKRRSAREREDIFKYASEGLIMQLLPVLDNLERALAARGDSVAKVIEGIEMICRQFSEVLEKEGVIRVPAVGELFDPSRHEAVMQEEGCDLPENTVTAEFVRGYCFKGKVIRPAMVKVAKN